MLKTYRFGLRYDHTLKEKYIQRKFPVETVFPNFLTHFWATYGAIFDENKSTHDYAWYIYFFRLFL